MSQSAFSSDAPAPPRSVVLALAALDPGMFLAFAKYKLDLRTMQPLVRNDGSVIEWPAWHVMLERRDRVHHLFEWRDPITNAYCQPDMRIIKKIASDLGRHYSADQINRMVDKALHEDERRKEEALQGERHDFVVANKGKVKEVLDDADNLTRDRSKNMRSIPAISYPGQQYRGDPGQVPMTAKEEGWEMLPGHEEDE